MMGTTKVGNAGYFYRKIGLLSVPIPAGRYTSLHYKRYYTRIAQHLFYQNRLIILLCIGSKPSSNKTASIGFQKRKEGIFGSKLLGV